MPSVFFKAVFNLPLVNTPYPKKAPQCLLCKTPAKSARRIACKVNSMLALPAQYHTLYGVSLDLSHHGSAYTI